MSSSKLNVAVIGCGLLAQSQHLPNIVSSERLTLHTCCDLNQAYLDHCQQRFSPRHISNDFHASIHHPEVDLIVVATTEKFRVPIVEAAAAAKKPVYMEKPVADSWANVRRIQQLVHASGIPFCVGHNRRCSPAMIEAQRIFRSHMDNPAPCNWRYDREGSNRMQLPAEDGVACMSIRINDDWYSWKRVHMEGPNSQYGGLLFEMTHFVDLACWFIQSDPVAVFTHSSGMLNHVVSIRFANGELASLLMASNGTFGYPKELYEVFGNGAAVVVDHMVEVRTAGIADAPTCITYPLLNDRHPDVGTELGLHGWLKKKHAACEEAAQQQDPLLQFTAEPDKGHARMLEAFIDEIEGKRGVVCGIDSAALASKICFAAMRSVDEKREVLLTEIDT